MKTISKTLLLGLATVGLCLTSCETLENRISEHPDIFNSLSPRDQALVRQGQIRSGMSMNAVWLAWGSPEQKTVGEMRGHPSETWIYVENRTAPYGSAYYPFYDPFYYSYIPPTISIPYKTVTFSNGRVMSFQYLAPPYR